MKIKIFTNVRSDLLEHEVNNFIEDKKVIDIKYQSFVDGKLIFDRIVVLYKERN